MTSGQTPQLPTMGPPPSGSVAGPAGNQLHAEDRGHFKQWNPETAHHPRHHLTLKTASLYRILARYGFFPQKTTNKPAPSKQTKKQKVRTNQPCTDVTASEMASVGGKNGGLRHRCEFLGRAEDKREENGSLDAKRTTLPGASSGKIKVGCELPDPVFSVHFLQFHPAVLKPDFNLSVREVDAAADL